MPGSRPKITALGPKPLQDSQPVVGMADSHFSKNPGGKAYGDFESYRAPSGGAGLRRRAGPPTGPPTVATAAPTPVQPAQPKPPATPPVQAPKPQQPPMMVKAPATPKAPETQLLNASKAVMSPPPPAAGPVKAPTQTAMPTSQIVGPGGLKGPTRPYDAVAGQQAAQAMGAKRLANSRAETANAESAFAPNSTMLGSAWQGLGRGVQNISHGVYGGVKGLAGHGLGAAADAGSLVASVVGGGDSPTAQALGAAGDSLAESGDAGLTDFGRMYSADANKTAPYTNQQLVAKQRAKLPGSQGALLQGADTVGRLATDVGTAFLPGPGAAQGVGALARIPGAVNALRKPSDVVQTGMSLFGSPEQMSQEEVDYEMNDPILGGAYKSGFLLKASEDLMGKQAAGGLLGGIGRLFSRGAKAAPAPAPTAARAARAGRSGFGGFADPPTPGPYRGTSPADLNRVGGFGGFGPGGPPMPPRPAVPPMTGPKVTVNPVELPPPRPRGPVGGPVSSPTSGSPPRPRGTPQSQLGKRRGAAGVEQPVPPGMMPQMPQMPPRSRSYASLAEAPPASGVGGMFRKGMHAVQTAGRSAPGQTPPLPPMPAPRPLPPGLPGGPSGPTPAPGSWRPGQTPLPAGPASATTGVGGMFSRGMNAVKNAPGQMAEAASGMPGRVMNQVKNHPVRTAAGIAGYEATAPFMWQPAADAVFGTTPGISGGEYTEQSNVPISGFGMMNNMFGEDPQEGLQAAQQRLTPDTAGSVEGMVETEKRRMLGLGASPEEVEAQVPRWQAQATAQAAGQPGAMNPPPAGGQPQAAPAGQPAGPGVDLASYRNMTPDAQQQFMAELPPEQAEQMVRDGVPGLLAEKGITDPAQQQQIAQQYMEKAQTGGWEPQDMTTALDNFIQQQGGNPSDPGLIDSFVQMWEQMEPQQQLALIFGVPLALAGFGSAAMGGGGAMGMMAGLAGLAGVGYSMGAFDGMLPGGGQGQQAPAGGAEASAPTNATQPWFAALPDSIERGAAGMLSPQYKRLQGITEGLGQVDPSNPVYGETVRGAYDQMMADPNGQYFSGMEGTPMHHLKSLHEQL